MNKIPIFPIIKVASSCNLGCKYCSAESYMERGTRSIMSDEILEATISELSRTQISPKYLWHGGEALLGGLEFYDRILELQHHYGIIGKNSIQTNGVLLTKKWVDFFKANNFNVGLSVDGPSDIHNENRVFSNGTGSHRSVMKGVSRLHKSKNQYGVLVVITSRSVEFPDEIFAFLLENGIRSMDFKPCYGATGNDVSLEKFAEFLKRVFDTWVTLDDPAIRIRTLEGYIHNLLGAGSRLCSQSGGCANYVTINTNGNIYPCDRFIQSNYKYGNITNRQLGEDIRNSVGSKAFTGLINSQRRLCGDCSIASVCKGGCTQERQYWPEEYCKHRFSIISHINDWLIAKGNESILTTIEVENDK